MRVARFLSAAQLTNTFGGNAASVSVRTYLLLLRARSRLAAERRDECEPHSESSHSQIMDHPAFTLSWLEEPTLGRRTQSFGQQVLSDGSEPEADM